VFLRHPRDFRWTGYGGCSSISLVRLNEEKYDCKGKLELAISQKVFCSTAFIVLFGLWFVVGKAI
jgi:hypothetical protein